MTIDRMIELLKIERECILRNRDNNCDRRCELCDLIQKDVDLIMMYDGVINFLKDH